MIGRWLFALGAMMLVVSAAQGAPADPAKKTLMCLDKADTGQTSPQLCAGVLQAACVAAGRNDEKVTDAACAAKELAFWQAQLDKNWKLVQPLLAPDMRADQIAAQKLWLQYREKSCAIADKVDPGMMPGGSARCRMEETAGRVIALRAIVSALSEH